MSLKLQNLRRQILTLPIKLVLFSLFICIPVTTFGQISIGMANSIIIEELSPTNSFFDTQNTINIPNYYTKRAPNDLFYSFTLHKKMVVTISHCGSKLSDTFLSLLDEHGNLIATNDNYEGMGACTSTTNSYMKIELYPGTYYVVSEGFSQNGEITTNISCRPCYVQGDKFLDPIVAGSYGTGFQYSNTQNTADFTNQHASRTSNDVFYKFKLTKKMLVTMTHCGSILDNTYMFLLDSLGNTITINDDYSGDGGCASPTLSFIQRTLEPGTYYIVSEGYDSSGIITTNITGYVGEEFGYPNIPNNYSAAPEDVGSPGGSLNVSSTGGATYSIPIKVPLGVGGMQPSLAITYNSQSGNGMLGWGCNLSGISAITRGPKDIYHDGIAKGLTHSADEAYYLNGQRLIYVSGGMQVPVNPLAIRDTAVFYPESDPFTKVIQYRTLSGLIGFEVQSSDGMKYYYGKTAAARQQYTYNNSPRINSWYIDHVEDPLGNYMDYTYNTSNYCLYPSVISYGKNKNEANSLQNTITFNYEGRNDAQPFVLEGAIKGSMDNRLKTITCKTGSSTYRNYELQYDVTSDGSVTKFSRLTTVTEKNGAGEAMKPVKLNWSFLPSINLLGNPVTVNPADTRPEIAFPDQYFMSADLNGDGITDLVGFAPAHYFTTNYTYCYVYWGSIDSSGNVQYLSGDNYLLLPNINFLWKTKSNSPSVIDFNGDCINELLVPYTTVDKNNAKAFFCFVSGIMDNTNLEYPLKCSKEMPSYCTGDFNNDGIGEIIVVEKGQNLGKYPGEIISKSQGKTINRVSLNFTLPSKTEEVFASDFNSDGLADLMIFYKEGYTIFWNQGYGLSANTFSDTNKTTGTNIGSESIMVVGGIKIGMKCKISQGDFNGDGLPDFLLNAANSNRWYFALNKGDGTFEKTQACILDIYDQSFTAKDDNKFECFVYDFDLDGKSDVVIHKTMYDMKSDISGTWGEINKTYTFWMRSTGKELTQVRMASSNREDDGISSHYLLGDFNGDGQVNLMNYGYDCYNSTDANVNPSWRLYKNSALSANSGKVIGVTNGFGSTTSITYASLINGGIYTKGSGSSYPMADLALPLHAVKTLTSNNGAAGNNVLNYQYNGLKAHLQGKGLLGMTAQTVTNTTMGAVTESGVKAWDATFYIPTLTYTKTTVANSTAETIVSMGVEDKGGKKYFAYPTCKSEKDLDGNTTTTTYQVNTTYGYPESETADFGNSMYKTVRYENYVLAGKTYKPQLITSTQKHADDASEFVQKTAISYNLVKGWKDKVVENSESSLPITTDYTYDTWGNVLTSTASGSGITPLKSKIDYDETKRFVLKNFTIPASTVNSFTYDTWGNVLCEKDETNPSAALTTAHTYDPWGNRTSTTTPAGQKTVFSKGWNNNPLKQYFTLVQATGQPWVKTWYDNQGREVLLESIGEKGMTIQQLTTYNDKGQVARKKNQTGNLSVTEDFNYDARGRLSSQNSSVGNSTSCTYGNRVVTTVSNGRSYTKNYDAWGGIKSSTDPVSQVAYTYTSLGKPKTVTTENAVLSMTYDNVGNQLTMTDPNAGMTTYTYDAAGRMIRQTDGRGKITENAYDIFGRLISTTVDGIATTYSYGTSDNEIFRLEKVQTGSNYVSYKYDKYGRPINEKRQVDGEANLLEFGCVYNPKGEVSRVTYPGELAVNYQYDAYGNKERSFTDMQSIWELTGATGTTTTSRMGGSLICTETRNAQGLLSNLRMNKDSQVFHNMDYVFDGATGNLTSRTGMLDQTEAFSYDNLDRLTNVKVGAADAMQMSYDANGNLSSKTGIGAYSYHSSKPHAVQSVENTGGLVALSTQSTVFNGFEKIQTISDAGSGYRLDFTYGPDQERWKSVLKQNDIIKKTTIFAGDYEQITENGSTRRLYYLDGAIYVKQDNVADKVYFACTDHLGSIERLVDATGTEVFNATYDVWGNQTITNNTFAFHRGYTGHEHLPEFDLINMNGRLYDPIIGRFLSPDPYVQMPDFSQNFNRYSYCLNNPLKFTDPSGELFGIDDAVIAMAVYAIVQGGMQGGFEATVNGQNFWSGAWKGAAIAAASSALTYGIGSAFGHQVGTMGKELLRAGAHGLNGGLQNVLSGDNFGVGFLTGMTSSLAGSGAQVAKFGDMGIIGATMATGSVTSGLLSGDWVGGAMQGMNIGMLNHCGGDEPLVEEKPLNGGWLKEVSVIGNKPSRSAREALIAASYIGKDKRRYGQDNNDANTIDCSGFTQEVAASAGYTLPRTSTQQMEWFKRNGHWSTNFSDAKPGNHVFYSGPNHTGIVVNYKGSIGIVHATGNGGNPGSIRFYHLNSKGRILPIKGFPHRFIGIGSY